MTVTDPGPLPGAEDVAAADFDGDGDPDVATAARVADQVAWHENELSESGADGFGDPRVISTEVSEAKGTFFGRGVFEAILTAAGTPTWR